MTTKNITVPDVGGAAEVDVIEVLVKKGDYVKVDTALITLESDKATMEVPSSDEGTVKEVRVKVGDKVSLGTTILILEGGEGTQITPSLTKSAETFDVEEKHQAVSSPPASASPLFVASPVVQSQANLPPLLDHSREANVYAGPAVRKLAREWGVDLAQVSGSGLKQRIIKEDVQHFVKTQLKQVTVSTAPSTGLPLAPVVDFAKFGAVESIPLSRIKKIAGKNLHRNWLLVPHVTQFGEADITALEEFRQAQKNQAVQQSVKITPLVFILKAVVAALKMFPQFNASLDGQGENLILKSYYHIGVAVDTPDGLVVPVLRHVDQKGLMDLAKELSDISEKARNKQLTAQDMQGGCFSISSLGGIGGTAFTPIVNVPEVAILGVSKSSHKPVYRDGGFIPRLMLPLSLSYDHRVIDGADGARFMVHLTNMLSDIRNLLL